MLTPDALFIDDGVFRNRRSHRHSSALSRIFRLSSMPLFIEYKDDIPAADAIRASFHNVMPSEIGNHRVIMSVLHHKFIGLARGHHTASLPSMFIVRLASSFSTRKINISRRDLAFHWHEMLMR